MLRRREVDSPIEWLTSLPIFQEWSDHLSDPRGALLEVTITNVRESGNDLALRAECVFQRARVHDIEARTRTADKEAETIK